MSQAWSSVSIRTVILVGSALLTVMATGGLVETEVFTLPTGLKYVLTVAAPLIIFAAALMRRPLHLITALAIIGAPFVGATAQLAGIRVSLLVPLLLAGFAVVAISDPVGGRPGTLRWAGILAFPLLLIPLVNGSGNHQFVASLALALALAWLVSQTASEQRGMKVVFAAFAVQAAAQAAIAIWGSETGRTLNLYSSPGTTQYARDYLYTFAGVTRPSGTFDDPIGLSNGLAIAVPLMVALLLTVRSASARLLLVMAVGLTTVALALTLDRTSWIATVAAVAVALVLLPRAVRRPAIPWLTAGMLAALAAATIVVGSALTGKLASIFDPTGTQGKTQAEVGAAKGEQDRTQYWSIALRDGFLHQPLAGIGIDNMGQLILDHSAGAGAGVRAGTGRFANAASTYLQLIGEGGLLAVALLLTLFYGLICDLRAGVRADPVLGAGLAGAVVALLICWATDVVVYSEPVAACVGALLGAVAAAGRWAPGRAGAKGARTER